MNGEVISAIFSTWTVVVGVLMVGIGLWAWSGAKKADFEAASRIPLEADDELAD
ncbi:MAG: cbb3-type cytochrome c oxidase subunit 3 [Gammaproteobacteria bacterium]|nr:cbb3-type cytochrome c oxidase subunit 3 [Gammaproteobacteria bacterium]